jgi:hypothetical protein
MAAVGRGRARSLCPDGSGGLIERAVWPVAVVVVDEDAEHAFEVAAVHDQ